MKRRWSLDTHLRKQGVTTTEGIRRHMTFVNETLKANPAFDITTYRVNPADPNGIPHMG